MLRKPLLFLFFSLLPHISLSFINMTPRQDSQASSLDATASTRVGFIGCGTIASALAKGIATQTSVSIDSISVSLRSEKKSTELKETFPDLVTVHADNQKILERSDLVFVCVLPQHASEILQSLTFDSSRHELISLVATVNIDDMVRDSKLPPSLVSKLICLPSIARHQGVALHCAPESPNPLVTKLLHAMGGAVTCDNEAQLQACMMSTCLMGPFYGTLRTNRDWLIQKGGLSKKDASFLVIKQYQGMIQDAVDRMEEEDDTILDELIEEQTPGGLNEQALTNLKKLGGLEMSEKVMDAIVSRIKGESDGSV